MAAVAGAVADEIGAAIAQSDISRLDGTPELTRWMVNNGGDIAIWLAQGQSYRVGVVMNHNQARGTNTQPTAATGDNVRPTAAAITIDSEMRSGLGSGPGKWRATNRRHRHQRSTGAQLLTRDCRFSHGPSRQRSSC